MRMMKRLLILFSFIAVLNPVVLAADDDIMTANFEGENYDGWGHINLDFPGNR